MILTLAAICQNKTKVRMSIENVLFNDLRVLFHLRSLAHLYLYFVIVITGLFRSAVSSAPSLSPQSVVITGNYVRLCYCVRMVSWPEFMTNVIVDMPNDGWETPSWLNGVVFWHEHRLWSCYVWTEKRNRLLARNEISLEILKKVLWRIWSNKTNVAEMTDVCAKCAIMFAPLASSRVLMRKPVPFAHLYSILGECGRWQSGTFYGAHAQQMKCVARRTAAR